MQEKKVDLQNEDGNDMTCPPVKTTCLVRTLGDGCWGEGQYIKTIK